MGARTAARFSLARFWTIVPVVTWPARHASRHEIMAAKDWSLRKLYRTRETSLPAVHLLPCSAPWAPLDYQLSTLNHQPSDRQ